MATLHTQTTLVDLPNDIHYCIFRNLSLRDIGRIRQTCADLNTSISEDKQLWLYILERETMSKALPSPRCSLSIEKASASDVLQWIKSSVTISRNCSSGANFTVMRSKLPMGVTWTKIVRGRWCLIACSDFDASQLLVWDIQNLSGTVHKAAFHLSGPVVDGIVNDMSSEIVVALTLGQRVPSILVLELFTDGKEVCIRRLSEIPGASHILLLQRPYIGFSVYDGDDTYPSIMNWETGYSRRFIHPESVHNIPVAEGWNCYIKHSPCNGMFLWGSYVLVIFPHKIIVFGQTQMLDHIDDSTLSNAAYLQVYHLRASCAESCILEDQSYSGVKHHQSTLHLVKKGGRGGGLTLLTMEYIEAMEAPNKIAFEFKSREYFKVPSVGDTISSTRIFCIGPSSQHTLALAINHHASWPPPCIYTAQVERTEHSVGFGPITRIFSKGMPLLHEVSSMVFDDGFGLFILGTISGEVCVRSFGATFPYSSLDNDLPVFQAPSEFTDIVPVGLPVIYKIRGVTPRLGLSPNVREMIVAEALDLWTSSTPVPQIPGWSSDWSSFRHVEHWIATFPRRGALDNIANSYGLIGPRVRERLGTLGEMIPVLFDEATHYRVLFRIGDRMYYCKSRDSKDELTRDDDDVDDDFDDYDPEFDGLEFDDILGILPVTYTQFLGMDIASIEEIVGNGWMQRNLYSNDVSILFERTYGQTRILNAVRKLVTKQYGEYPGDKVLEDWSDEDWAAIREIAWNSGLSLSD